MSGYYYRNSEPGLWTVGCDDGNGHWQAESDHGHPDKAAQRVALLNGNGGNTGPSQEQLVIGIMAAIISAGVLAEGGVPGNIFAVNMARDLMDTVLKTEPE